MPFLQFSPPKPKPAPKKKKDVEYKAVVNLAPFSPNPKLFIEDVVVGSTITANIIIRNPSSQPVKVAVIKVPPVEREVLLNWTDNEVPACGDCCLQVLWKPTVSGAWREVIRLKDQFGSRRDVPIVFKAIPPPKKLKRVVKPNSQTVSKPTVVSKKSHINQKRRSSPFTTNIKRVSTGAKNSPRPEIFLPPSQLPALPACNVPSTPLRRLTYLVEKNSEEDKENTHRNTTGEVKILTPQKSFNTTADIKDFSKMINFNFNFNSSGNGNTSVSFKDQISKKPLQEVDASVNYLRNNLKNNIIDNEETYNDSLEYIPDGTTTNKNVPTEPANKTYDSHSKYLGNENVNYVTDNRGINISTMLNSESYCFTPVGEARHVNKINRTIDLKSDDTNLSINVRSSTVSPRRTNLQYLNIKTSPYSDFEPTPMRRSAEMRDSFAIDVKNVNLKPHAQFLNIKTSPYSEFEPTPMRRSAEMRDSFAVNVKNVNLKPHAQFLNIKTSPYTEFDSTSTGAFGNNIRSTNLTPHRLSQQYLNVETSPYMDNGFSPRSCSTEIKEPLSANNSRKSDSDARKHLFSTSSPRFNNSYCLSSPNNLGGLSSDTYTKHSFEKDVSNNERCRQRNDFNEKSLRSYEDNSFRRLQSPVDRKPENVSLRDKSHEFNISGKEARDVIEANLWAEPCKKSPARLECIQEENSESLSSNVSKIIKNNENNSLRMENTSPGLKLSSKRKAPPLLRETVFDISPPRKIAGFDKTVSLRKVVKEPPPVITGWSKFGVKYDKAVVTAKIQQYENDELDALKGIKFTPVVLENPDPFTKKLVIDPFLSRTIYYDAQWITKQEVTFRKWLNSLLAPPVELDCSNVCETVDVAELVSKNNERVSRNFHMNSRLNALRKSACKLFQSREMTTVLARTKSYIEKRQLKIRADQNIHANIGLQQRITRILLCYNPLWLRIGLEAIYNEHIPMESNADRKGLTKFIVSRLYQDPYLKAKDANKTALKKFTLLKFLILVYFLDQAKTKKLIRHDPCLFCVDAPIKESREVLLAFSREMLSAIDIIRYLKGSDYVVNHKQKSLDEFDYTVTNLAIDLRDGIRITRVMEIILMKNDLSKDIQIPASSRLRKVHNVKIAFDALDYSGFFLNGDIDPKDIVDGHREKTMSFLWQVVYNFATPYFSKSAVVIQKWWRSPRIVANRLVLKREREAKLLAIRSRAAITIQRHVRKFLQINRDRKSLLQKKNAAIRIQRWFRATREMRKCIHEYKTIRSKVTCLQTRWRATLLMRNQRQVYLKKINAIRNIQIRWRATLLMRQQSQEYLEKISSIQVIQSRWRATLLMRQQRQEFLKKISALRIIQTIWRATLLMRNQKQEYLTKVKAIRTIQIRWRATLLMRNQRQVYLKKINAIRNIQIRWRATLLMRQQSQEYLEKISSIQVIQSRWRAMLLMRQQRQEFLKKISALRIIQTIWRATLLMRNQKQEYLTKVKAIRTIQIRWRATLLMRNQRQVYLKKINAIRNIQIRWRATLLMRQQSQEYLEKISSIQVIQSRWRAMLLMRQQRQEFLKKISALRIIQTIWRATLLMRNQKQEYLTKVKAIRTIQIRWRATLLMRNQRQVYLKKINAIRNIQIRWRATLLMRQQSQEYLEKVNAIRTIQIRWRVTLLMRQQRQEYLKKLNAIRTIQDRWRATIMMLKEQQQFRRKIEAVKVIQKFVRKTNVLRRYNSELKKQTEAARIIQAAWRGYKVRKFESQQMTLVRQRSQEAADNAQPENAVRQRVLAAVDLLGANGSMFDILRALHALDFLSRLLPTSFIAVCDHITEQLYLLMTTLNRSVPHMEACILSASTLINLATFPQTKHAVWKEEHIETLLGLLMTWSDKEGKLFPYLCTLVWLICENREHAKTIKDFPRAIDRLKKIFARAHRFDNMVNKKAQKSIQGLNHLPSTKFDWGIVNSKRPRTFKNSLFGITSVLKKLEIAIPK